MSDTSSSGRSNSKKMTKRHDTDSSSSSASSSPSSSPKQQQQQTRQQKQQQRRKHSTLSKAQQALQDYVPKYLKPYVSPYHGEFCYTPIFKTRFIAQLMAEGFLPVATRGMLLPKLHLHRSVIQLPDELHVSKSVRKKSKRFSISINKEFDKVIEGCHAQHGSHCWLYPPLVKAFREMMQLGKIEATPMDPDTGKPYTDEDASRCWTVRLYTIEVWNEETGALAGGELGYTVGSIYTSLTGFTKEDSAGSVQLIALGRLLSEKGFHLWDLGMDMEYKRGIGAKLMPRDSFVQQVHAVRETMDHLLLPDRESPPQNCKEVIDRNQPASQQQQQQQQQSTSQKPKKQKQPKNKKKGATQQQQHPPVNGAAEETCNNNDSAREQTHTPPTPETETPVKRVRKSESQESVVSC